MCAANDLHEKIAAYYDTGAADPHHRYRSWEHCHRFFRARPRETLLADKDTAALHLAFYLASWGMLRGSTFLLQKAYTAHTGVVERLLSPEFAGLWQQEVGSGRPDEALLTTIVGLVDAVEAAYAPFGPATDTLITKVILGTIGCLPAVDRFFVDGFRKCGYPYSRLNAEFIVRILMFCNKYVDALRTEQDRIEAAGGMRYPLMKLADMYFWQIGYDAAPPKAKREADGLE